MHHFNNTHNYNGLNSSENDTIKPGRDEYIKFVVYVICILLLAIKFGVLYAIIVSFAIH